eukprot:TRINITY_DN5728_c0_g1_i1.p1 TRINITY_DN5728_c0_g1~~TRINITY_DN5728_c0_g1_i1.p1  ORF type:complete len:542 (-),score=48.91 TRINITY_DN5728_c0_g1_i1:1643-3139(-)
MASLLGRLVKQTNGTVSSSLLQQALTLAIAATRPHLQQQLNHSSSAGLLWFQQKASFADQALQREFGGESDNSVDSLARQLSAQASLQGTSIFTVEVVTGDLRGAGTELPAYLKLFGDKGESQQFEIGKENEDEKDPGGFPRDSIRRYALKVDTDIGDIKRIHIGLPQTLIYDTNISGWFLEKVTVWGPGGQRWKFPCQSWFGMDESGESKGDLERNLFPCATGRQLLPAKRVKVNCGGIAIPHPEKQKEGKRGYAGKHSGYAGEDAYFFSHGRNGIIGMGVADGVYAWKDQGIDSGLFSRKLMEYSSSLVRGGFEDVLKIMQISNRQLQSEGVYGSSTCCIATVDTNTGRFNIANLGDSGLLVINTQTQQIKYRTSQLEHEFGFPFQLGHHSNADKPESARLATLRLDQDDVIVMGTDGLFDNLCNNDIVKEITNLTMERNTPLQIARHLCGLAYHNSIDKSKVTPYSLAATEWFNMVYNGGKKDDITVVVSHISEG